MSMEKCETQMQLHRIFEKIKKIKTLESLYMSGMP